MKAQLTQQPYFFWFLHSIDIQPTESGKIEIPNKGVFAVRKMPHWRYLLCKYCIPFVMLACVLNANDWFLSLQKFLQYFCAALLVAILSLTDGILRTILVLMTLLTTFVVSIYRIDITFVPFVLKYAVLFLLLVYFAFDLRVKVFEVFGNHKKTHLITKEEL